MISLYYFGLKIGLLAGIIKAYTASPALAKHLYAVAGLYTASIALLSWVFFIAPNNNVNAWPSFYGQVDPGWPSWGAWLGATFVLSFLYFKLLDRFDEGGLFWVILLGGLGLLVYF